MTMSEEERKQKEDAAQAARRDADEAHEAAAQADGVDEALNKAADEAEDAAQQAQADLDAADPAPATPAPAGEEVPPAGAQDIDFEKELEVLGGDTPPAPPAPAKSELEKAERALFFNAQRLRELGGDPTKVVGAPPTPPAPPADAPPAPLTPPAYVTQEDLAKRDLVSEIRKLSRSEAERKVTEWHAEHSIQRSGDPVKDAENAYLIAHKGRITRSFEEIRRAGGSRPMPGAAPGRRPAAGPTKAPVLEPSEQAVMKRRGFKPQPDGSWEGKRYRMHYDQGKKAWVTERKS